MMYTFARSHVPRRGPLRTAVLFAFIFCFFAVSFSHAATYYVRTDGGSAAQCTGLANAPYSGSGTAQACAWSHPFIALPPKSNEHQVPPRIQGGDTLIIGHGSYMMGFGAAGTPEMEACYSGYTTDCHMQPIPAGPDADHKTRVLGEGWDQGCSAPPELWATMGAYHVVNMTSSSNTEVGCLELTDHASCIVNHCFVGNCTGGPTQIDRCVSNTGTWGNNGLWSTDATNVQLHDVNIHGFGGEGVHAGRMTNWDVQRVRIWANGFAGWDADVSNGGSAPTSNSGSLHFSNLEIAWSGCGERYPSGEIFGCWDQNEGGYGDGFATGRTSGDWVFEDSHIHHNVSDGLDLLYADGTGSVTMSRIRAEGNAGNQLKVAGSATIEDSVVIGSCAEPWSTFPQNNDPNEAGYSPSQFVGRYNMELSGNCRASGDAIAMSLAAGQTTTVRQNTITGQGNCLVTAFRGDANTHLLLSNNVLYGSNNDWLTFATGGGTRLTCGFGYWQEDGSPSAQITYDNNLFWAVRNNQCPAGSLCFDPQLNGQALEAFSALPKPNSPIINASNLSDPGALDNRSVERPQLGGYDLGAIEYRGVNSPDNIMFTNGFDGNP